MMNEWIISSSLLIVALLLGRKLLKGKISLRLQYALWAVVLVRLLLPVQLFTSNFGAGSIAREVDVAAPVRQAYTAARTETFEIQYSEAYTDVVKDYASQGRTATAGELQQETLTRVEETRKADLSAILLGVWLAGMAILTVVLIGSNVHFALRLRRSRRELADVHLPLPVCETAAVSTPCLFGLFPPVIYLTPEMARDEGVRTHILAHEQTHYRHGDHIWALLRNICLVLHWYNPLVWIAARVSKADAELACDEGTLSRLGEEARADYGRTLIGLTCAERFGASMIAATTMTGSKRTLTERIRLLMKRPRNTILTLTAVLLVGAIVVGVAFSTAPEEPAPQTPTVPAADPNDPSTDLDGLLVYPGTTWNMTPAAVRESLGLENDASSRSSMSSGADGGFTRKEYPDQKVFGYTATVEFYYEYYDRQGLPGLKQVLVVLDPKADMEALYESFTRELGEAEEVEEGTVYRWDSTERLSVYSGDVTDTEPASQIYFINGNTRPLTGVYALTGKAVLFVSELPRAIQQGGDPEYGTLTQAQIDRVNEAFAATLSVGGSQRVNPLAGYFASYYSDATQIDLAAYLRHSVDHYHDGDILEAAEAAGLDLTEEEAQARGIRRVHAHHVAEQVRADTGSDFQNWTDYRQSGDGVTYLAGFDNYYVEPLDTAPAEFVCIGGHYDDGWAELYSETSVLTLAKMGGSYKFVSHLPREEAALSVDGVQSDVVGCAADAVRALHRPPGPGTPGGAYGAGGPSEEVKALSARAPRPRRGGLRPPNASYISKRAARPDRAAFLY